MSFVSLEKEAAPLYFFEMILGVLLFEVVVAFHRLNRRRPDPMQAVRSRHRRPQERSGVTQLTRCWKRPIYVWRSSNPRRPLFLVCAA
jgi:hypothetical protein